MSTRKNIILICVDQMRADAWGLGGGKVETPYLDDLALKGMVFERAYAAVPTCIPARAGLLTGMSARLSRRCGYTEGVDWDYRETIAESFRKNGYQTHAVGKMHVHPARKRLGFEEVVLHDGTGYPRGENADRELYDDYFSWAEKESGHDVDTLDHGVGSNAHHVRPWPHEERIHPTNFVVTKGLEFLKRRDPSRPFFLTLSFVRPHPPLDPPDWALDRYLGADTGNPVNPGWADDLFGHQNTPGLESSRRPVLSEDALQRKRAGYFGCITHLDHQIGRFLHHLGVTHGLRQDTVIAFTSDHGELLGDFGFLHKTLPYEGSARVPLILSGPGIPSGVKSGAVAELRDVMPTLLDLAGCATPESIDGKSLIPCMEDPEANVRRWLHGEHPFNLHGSGESVHWIVDGNWKYIWFSGKGEEQLFNLREDPREEQDLSRDASSAEKLAELQAVLVHALSDRPEGYVENGRLRTEVPCLNLLPKPLPPLEGF